VEVGGWGGGAEWAGSGDLVTLSQQVRSLLPGVPIFASGDLDEYQIAELKAAGACIDGYGLGTQLVTGSPVNGVYKLVEIDSIPVMKEDYRQSHLSRSQANFPALRPWPDQGRSPRPHLRSSPPWGTIFAATGDADRTAHSTGG
jgi:hypothetical protein